MAKITPPASAARPVKPAKEKKAGRPAFEVKGPITTPLPDGFKFDTHAPLKPKDFDSKKTFFLHQAAKYDHLAAQARLRSENPSAGGSAERKQARLAKTLDKAKELVAQLAANGHKVDLSELLAKLQG